MPRVSVYLPAELHQAVKAEDIPVSEVCQRALARELERRRYERTARQAILWDRNPTNRRQ